MSFKKFGVTLAAMMALGAVLATSAFAGTAVTDPAAWVQTNGVAQTINEETINCRDTAGEPVYVFTTTILGQHVRLTSEEIECPGAKIKTTGTGTNEKMAILEGKFTFKNITVDEPVGCKANNITTNALLGDLQMDEADTAKSYLKIVAQSGGALANIVLTNCAAAGTYPLKGALFTEATDPTGTHTTGQKFAGNATTTAMSSLTIGTQAATFEGEFEIELTSGRSWGFELP